MSWAYLEDASGFRGFADEVLVPASESALLEIVDRARGSKTPLTIAGAGSGITGGRCPEGGWLVSMEKFTKLEIQPALTICGAGVHLMDLHAAARQRQLIRLIPRKPSLLSVERLPAMLPGRGASNTARRDAGSSGSGGTDGRTCARRTARRPDRL